MFFNESEYLLAEGVAGQSVIEAADGFLSKRSTRDRIDPRTMALTLDTSATPETLQRVLEAYQGRGLLRSSIDVECPRCGTFAPLDDLRQAEAAGDDYPCPGPCQGDLAADDELGEVRIFQLHETPTPPARSEDGG